MRAEKHSKTFVEADFGGLSLQLRCKARSRILGAIRAILFSAMSVSVVSLSNRAVAQVPSNGLIGYWTGNYTAADTSTIGNNGSFSGSYVPGGPGGDAAFNLASGKVTIPNNAAYDAFQSDPGWTVGFWFNMNGTNPSNNGFLGQDNGAGHFPKWLIDYGYTASGSNTDFVWHVNDYNVEGIFLTSQSVSPVPSGWNQLTVVADNTNSLVTFYLDGQQIGTDGLPSYVLETTAPLIFGQTEALSFNGLMNNVTIYDRALSIQEVKELQNVPEPASVTLIGIGIFALLLRRQGSYGGIQRV